MPLINVEELEAKAKKKEEEKSVILVKEIGDKKVFGHKEIPGQWYERQDEALQAAQDAKRKREYKSQGLDENGLSKEDAEKARKIKELLAKKQKLVEEIQKIDVEIAQVKRPGFSAVKDEKKKK